MQYKQSNNKRLLVELSLMRISSILHQMAEKKSHKSFVVSLNDQKKQVSVEKVTEIDEKIEKATESHKKPEIESNSEIADLTPKSIPRISLSSKKKSKTISITCC